MNTELRSYSPAAGISRTQDQACLAGDERAPSDSGDDLAPDDIDRALKNAPSDAFLFPDFARLEFAIGKKAGQLGARPSPAGRTIVGLSGAENKVLAVDAGLL